MKSIFLAMVVTAPLALTLASAPARADTDVGVRLYFGEPYYDHRVGPDYMYRKGYGWYRPRSEIRKRLTCGEARSIVRRHGYHNISVRDCRGATYAFRTWKNGRSHIVYVNSRTGGLWRG
jgi:hypothetical protein